MSLCGCGNVVAESFTLAGGVAQYSVFQLARGWRLKGVHFTTSRIVAATGAGSLNIDIRRLNFVSAIDGIATAFTGNQGQRLVPSPLVFCGTGSQTFIGNFHVPLDIIYRDEFPIVAVQAVIEFGASIDNLLLGIMWEAERIIPYKDEYASLTGDVELV